MDISQVAIDSLALLHIVGGQTVIGRVTAKDDKAITLSKPLELLLMPHPQQPQQMVIGLAPYLSMFGKLTPLDMVSIPLPLVITPRAIPSQLERDYLSSTSGIDLNSKLAGNNTPFRR
jgi:hypothetical protein